MFLPPVHSRCLDKASSLAKVRLQFSHMNGLIPMCSCMCRLQSCCRAKPEYNIRLVDVNIKRDLAEHTLVTPIKGALVRSFLIMRPNVTLEIELPGAVLHVSSYVAAAATSTYRVNVLSQPGTGHSKRPSLVLRPLDAISVAGVVTLALGILLTNARPESLVRMPLPLLALVPLASDPESCRERFDLAGDTWSDCFGYGTVSLIGGRP